MEINKLENSIKEKLSNRTIQPSASAWERLSTKLDEQPHQKKRGWVFYIGAAASILLLITVGIQFFSSDDDFSNENEIVLEDIQFETLHNDIKKHHEKIPVEKAIVIVDEIKEKPSFKKDVLKEKRLKQQAIPSTKIKTNPVILKESLIAVAQVEKVLTIDTTTIKHTEKETVRHRIKVNSDDLLYAATHSSEDVQAYYATNNTSQEEVLATIKNELKKRTLTIDPNTILAEVEETIMNLKFDNNFLKSLKKKITNIATAIASRND